jgi:hypothetical protein
MQKAGNALGGRLSGALQRCGWRGTDRPDEPIGPVPDRTQ